MDIEKTLYSLALWLWVFGDALFILCSLLRIQREAVRPAAQELTNLQQEPVASGAGKNQEIRERCKHSIRQNVVFAFSQREDPPSCVWKSWLNLRFDGIRIARQIIQICYTRKLSQGHHVLDQLRHACHILFNLRKIVLLTRPSSHSLNIFLEQRSRDSSFSLDFRENIFETQRYCFLQKNERCGQPAHDP